jgi:hypothetical protein
MKERHTTRAGCPHQEHNPPFGRQGIKEAMKDLDPDGDGEVSLGSGRIVASQYCSSTLYPIH